MCAFFTVHEKNPHPCQKIERRALRRRIGPKPKCFWAIGPTPKCFWADAEAFVLVNIFWPHDETFFAAMAELVEKILIRQIVASLVVLSFQEAFFRSSSKNLQHGSQNKLNDERRTLRKLLALRDLNQLVFNFCSNKMFFWVLLCQLLSRFDLTRFSQDAGI